jgi:hypothetical protein
VSRASVKAGVAGALLVLLLPSMTLAASGTGGTPSSDDAAASIYVEHVPAADGSSEKRTNTGRSEDAATSIYVEHPAGASGSPGSSGARPASRGLEQLLTSPTLGAPQRVQPLPGGTDTAYGTFSFQTVREVAGIGTARLAVLLAVLILITVTVCATALTRLSKR